MPQIIKGLYFEYGPINPSPCADWRTKGQGFVVTAVSFAALIATAFFAARYGLP